MNDNDENYDFDVDIDELGLYDNSVECNYRKIDFKKIRRDKAREFILNHQNRSALKESS